MNNYSKYTLLLVLLAISAVTIIAEDKSEKEQLIEAQIDLVAQQRATQIAKAMALTEEAKELAAKQNSKKSLKKFIAAQKLLGTIEGSLAKRKLVKLNELVLKYRGRWASALMSKARKAAVLKKYTYAISLAAEATLIDSRKANESSSFVEYCNRKIKSSSYRKKTTLTEFDKKYQKKEDDIALLYREAVIMYKNKRYAEARSKIERIFLKDPYNREATYLLGKVYNKLYQVGEKRKEADTVEILAQGAWKWMQPVLPTETRKRIKGGAEVKKDSSSDLYERMRKIIFPVVEFENASIKSVIKYLSKMSKRYDPAKKGVNIVSGITNAAVEGGMMVDMSFSDMPMSEILRYISKYTGLKYKVENNVVVIGSGNDVDSMDRRSFKLRASMVADIAGIEITEGGDGGNNSNNDTGEGKGGTLDQEDLFDAETTFEDTQDRKSVNLNPTNAALIKYFEDRGIKFGPGASVSYSQRASKLFVKNTPDNLRKLESLLRQIDIETPLVLVEAKLIEIAQRDLEELGFDWVLDVNVDKALAGDSSWAIPKNNNPLRHYESKSTPNSTSTSSKPFKVINDLKIFPNFGKKLFGKNNDVNLSLTVNAVDQNSRSESLAAPKVITTSGSRATIRMVRSEFFPTSWEEPEIETSNNTTIVHHAIPEFDEATNIGVIFEVEPTVGPDNYTITLHIVPQVIDFLQWSLYSYYFQYSTTTTNAFGQPTTSTTTINGEIKMPEITHRDLDIKVKVYDGETIVIGGMIDARSRYRDDKYPFLGEVPLLGRFFRSQMSDIEKINLVIFVTARLINNDGVPVRSKNRGITDFFR
jgi:general secretion pathway protein D